MGGLTENNDRTSGGSLQYKNPGMVLSAIESIDSVIQITSDANVVLDRLMDKVIGIFNSSRAWLFHPCNPNLPSFDVAFESTSPEYPGAKSSKQKVPMTDDMANYCKRALSAVDGPEIDPPVGNPVSNDIAIRFNVKSMLFMALRPKSGEPWMFGLHQCDFDRIWTSDEKQLFHMIGQRITGCIDNLLYVRQLKESEERLSLALEAVCDAVWDWRVDTGEVHFNSGWYKILGFKPYELPQDYSTWTNLLHPEDRDYAEKVISQNLETNDPFSMEFRMRTKDGQWKWLLGRGKTVERDTKGNAVRMIGTNVDISDRKILEEKIAESKKELQLTLEATTDGIWTWNFDTNKFFFSNKYYTMLGYEPGEFPAGYDNWVSLIHPDDRDKAVTFASDYLKTKSDLYENEFRLKCKNGDYLWIKAHGRVVERNENNDAVYIIGNHEDITERKKTEIALQQSEQKNRSILDAIPDLMFILSKDGTTLDFRAHSANELYRSPDKIIGANIKESMPSEFVATCMHYIKKTLNTENLTCFEYQLPYQDGAKYYEARLVPCGENNVLAIVRHITERKLAEKALIESEKRFRTLIEAGPLSILLLRDGKYIYGNPASAKMLGYEDPDEIIGISALETIAPEYHEIVFERIKNIDQGKSNSPIEIQLIKPDGEMVWSLTTSVSVTIEDKPTAIIMGQDITALRKAEQDLSKAQTMQVALAEHLPAGMMLVDASTRKIESVNVYAASIFGAGIDEIVGKKCHNSICPASEGECPICDLGQEIDNAEREIVLKNGDRSPVLKSVVSIKIDEKEKLLEYFVDISDRKRAEVELRESEERYRKLVTTAPYGIQLTDREGRIIFSNPAHHRIQGYKDDELIGKFIWDLMADAEHQQQAKKYYQKIIQDHPTPEIYFNRDKTLDGREIDVQINWDYIYDSNGQVEGIISIISDITNQRLLETKLQQAQKMESIGNLAGGIAHDFNNILFPIIGISELLMEDFSQDSKQYENLQEIFRAGKRGSDLVKQILAFGRQSEHKLIPVHLQPILNEVLKLSRATIPSSIEIRHDIQPDCGLVLADATQIHQVIINIITNAYHAVESSDGTISVSLRKVSLPPGELPDLSLTGKHALISIADTGHGMSSDLIEKIFEPYFTTKEQGKGTGLGLAVAYGIIKEHKGGIKVTSEVGKGTTFRIYIPLMDKPIEIESTNEIELSPSGSEHILLVDDEEPIAKIERQMLERLGYKVTSRMNSIDALEAFKANPDSFDLVLSDMSMPNMRGDQLAKEIISIRQNIPLIICTGFSDKINQEKAVAIGIKGFLMKPILRSELAKTVRSVLDESKPHS